MTSKTNSKSDSASKTPYRQIRALYDEKTITVYQAYSKSIAEAAVKEQRLDASSDFKYSRMTWIKPSWCWMMYRAAYGTKDSRQSHILAIKMTHAWFRKLLGEAVVCHGQILSKEEKERNVRIQWDPERDPALNVLGWRSIQVGIGRGLVEEWVKEGIVGIEDVSEKAKGLMGVVQGKEEGWTMKGLVEMGLMPRECVFEVGEELRGVLGMDL